MQYPKTDNQLRGELIRAGREADIWALEALVSRDDIVTREEYRGELERLAAECGIDRMDTLPSGKRASVASYGPC